MTETNAEGPGMAYAPQFGGTAGQAAATNAPMAGWLMDSTEVEPKAKPHPTGLKLVSGAKFATGSWDPALRAPTIVATFFASSWADCRPRAPEAIAPDLAAEVRVLLDFMPLRPRYQHEIEAQGEAPAAYWAQMLMITAASHPNTWTLIATTMSIATIVSMYWKEQFRRARPSQVYPGLMPSIRVPSHPSFPSGHGLQARLTALALEHVTPPRAAAIRALADRIARNREIAGVHFPSDQQGSLDIIYGDQALGHGGIGTLLLDGPAKDLLAAAKAEWADETVGAEVPVPVPVEPAVEEAAVANRSAGSGDAGSRQ